MTANGRVFVVSMYLFCWYQALAAGAAVVSRGGAVVRFQSYKWWIGGPGWNLSYSVGTCSQQINLLLSKMYSDPIYSHF